MVKPFGGIKKFCILQLPISYCVTLIMVTITGYDFINIFQTEHFSAVKFATGYEKNMSFCVIPKSPKIWKKVDKITLGSFYYNPPAKPNIEQSGQNMLLLGMFKPQTYPTKMIS